MVDFDLLNCKNELEKRILSVENQILRDTELVKRDVQILQASVDKLVTRMEFEPVRLIAFGLAGGVLIAALGAVLAKVLGW